MLGYHTCYVSQSGTLMDLTVSIAQTRTGTCPSGSTGSKGGKP